MKTSLLKKLEESPSASKDDERILVLQHRGYIVFIGGNALSNDKLVAEHPHKTCLWFHAWGAKGAHIILCANTNETFDDDSILFAAHIALKHSRSNLRSVNYSRLEELYKPENGQAGVFRSRRIETLEVENGRE